MSKISLISKSFLKISLFSVLTGASIISGCTVSAKNAEQATTDSSVAAQTAAKEKTVNSPNLTKNSPAKNRIQIRAGSPADTIRIFYKNLREKHFREAMMMTNLRPAVENLSDAEMQDLNQDFEPLAAQVPADLEINGEIVANNTATVTAKLPDENGTLALKEHQLRRENNQWVIVTADEKEEATAKKEGKNYFFVLRIETHHGEVQSAMQEIARKQMAYALQNGGAFGDLPTLIAKNFLSPDMQNVGSTGYRFNIVPSADKKTYYATAEPVVYGKTGKLSYLLQYDSPNAKPRLKFEDNKGAPLKK